MNHPSGRSGQAAAAVISNFCSADVLRHLDEMASLMHQCVLQGASIGYVLPYSAEDGAAYWRTKVLRALDRHELLLLVARQGGVITGAVQLDLATAPNQRHRAEVRKLLVHPDWRRQGVARALMAELERVALQLGRSLLTLDTRSGDHAEPLYASLGYQIAGAIPGYCRDTHSERLDPTTIMYKTL